MGMVEIDEDDEMKYITEVTGCSEDEAYAVMDAEDDYFDTMDLNDGAEDVDEAFAEINVEELIAYITSKTGMTEEAVVTILEAEDEYLQEKGYID